MMLKNDTALCVWDVRARAEGCGGGDRGRRREVGGQLQVFWVIFIIWKQIFLDDLGGRGAFFAFGEGAPPSWRPTRRRQAPSPSLPSPPSRCQQFVRHTHTASACGRAGCVPQLDDKNRLLCHHPARPRPSDLPGRIAAVPWSLAMPCARRGARLCDRLAELDPCCPCVSN